MGDRFASGKKALAICDRCGFPYDLKDLNKETVKGVITNLKVCSTCFDEDHPQLHLGEQVIDDPQAIRDPRSDAAELAASRELTVPGGLTVEEYIAQQTGG